jgi:hypothetical protein
VLQLILEHWNIPIHLLALFLDHPDGLAALALLCNAGAKDWPGRPGDPRLYTHKANTVRWACLAAWPERSWHDEHQGMPIYFVETSLRLDDQPLQLAFHFRPGDTLPDLPADWPAANGRGWRGQQAQGRVLEIARSYLAGRGVSL